MKQKWVNESDLDCCESKRDGCYLSESELKLLLKLTNKLSMSFLAGKGFTAPESETITG